MRDRRVAAGSSVLGVAVVLRSLAKKAQWRLGSARIELSGEGTRSDSAEAMCVGSRTEERDLGAASLRRGL